MSTKQKKPAVHYVLWVVQVLMALMFLLAGVSKEVMSVADMTKDIALPGLFLRFIGVCEILGALGLILPSILRIRPGLTPLAASLLIPIMAGAVVTALMVPGGIALASIPLVCGLLAVFVAYGRLRLAPISPR